MMRFKKYFLIIGVILLVLGVVGRRQAYAEDQAARLYLKPDTDKLHIGQDFWVSLLVDTGGQDVNTVSAHFSYDSDILEFVDADVEQGVFPNVVERETEQAGQVKMTAFVVPNYNGADGLFGKFKFRTKIAGRADFVFLPSSGVYLADGRGTDILRKEELKPVAVEVVQEEGAKVKRELAGRVFEGRELQDGQKYFLLLLGVVLVFLLVLILKLIFVKKTKSKGVHGKY